MGGWALNFQLGIEARKNRKPRTLAGRLNADGPDERFQRFQPKPHTVPEKTGTGRQSGGRRPGLGLKSRPTGWDWLGLKIIRPTCCIASKLKRYRAPGTGAHCGLGSLPVTRPRDRTGLGTGILMDAFAVRIKQYQAKEHRRSYTGPRHASGQSVPGPHTQRVTSKVRGGGEHMRYELLAHTFPK